MGEASVFYTIGLELINFGLSTQQLDWNGIFIINVWPIGLTLKSIYNKWSPFQVRVNHLSTKYDTDTVSGLATF